MKKFIYASMVVAAMAFVSCSDDDDSSSEASSTDCFTCEIMGIETEYCYTDGDDYYTVTMMGQSVETPLSGTSWSSLKSTLEAVCD